MMLNFQFGCAYCFPPCAGATGAGTVAQGSNKGAINEGRDSGGTSTTQLMRRLHMSPISIIGSGGMAAAIGGLAAKAGHSVAVTSRDAAKARALARQVGAGATTGTSGAAPAGDIVILGVPCSAVLDVVQRYGDGLTGWLLSSSPTPSTPTTERRAGPTFTRRQPFSTRRARSTALASHQPKEQ